MAHCSPVRDGHVGDGRHWSVDGANAILALRCAILSNRFDDFWECRATAKPPFISHS